jgi:hypothetical protein
MAGDLEPAGADKPANDLEGSVPDGRPSQWPDTLFDTVVSWAFLGAIVEHHRVRPWLVLEQRPSGMGPVSFVVPRLVPEAGWHDSLAYRAWLESASRADSTPLPSVLTVAEAAEQLPPSPTRPRWANQERLVNVAVRADLVGRSSAQIVEEDGEANLPSDRARAVRKEIASARARSWRRSKPCHGRRSMRDGSPRTGPTGGQTGASPKAWHSGAQMPPTSPGDTHAKAAPPPTR